VHAAGSICSFKKPIAPALLKLRYVVCAPPEQLCVAMGCGRFCSRVPASDSKRRYLRFLLYCGSHGFTLAARAAEKPVCLT
jgi:hypothetical protein